MSKWLAAAKKFEERREIKDYFEMQSALGAIAKIETLLDGTFRQLIFLIGEPGSGKTFLLNLLYGEWSNKRHIVLIETPFLTPMNLLNQLIRHQGMIPKGEDMEELRLQATQLYTSCDHLILIDEAQLLSTEMREFIRILSDSKGFWFLLAMHRSEGEMILRAPHFKSRPHRVIELFPLSAVEAKNYIHREMIHMGFSEIIDELNPKLIAKAHHLSQGNFRNFKKLFYHLFNLLHYTNTHNKTKYLRPSVCTLTMAAIDAELIND
jgi:type II secretory pathway predicted ATPase ExeA